MTDSLAQNQTLTRTQVTTGSGLRRLVWLLFAVLVLRFLALWINAFAGTSLPVLGSIGLTLLFTAFSVLHAASLLGRRQALAFLLICAVVTWCFEEVGTATGLVYGAYHYGDKLGTRLGGVPVIIPLAWFTMIYASWIVAWILLQGAGHDASWVAAGKRALIAALAMTAWDVIMDPGMARSGMWTWEQGGAYFGVPLQNYAGWLATTLMVYALAELSFRIMPGSRHTEAAGLYVGLPALVYALLALDQILLPSLPELRIVAVFSMGFIALLAILRLGAGTRIWVGTARR